MWWEREKKPTDLDDCQNHPAIQVSKHVLGKQPTEHQQYEIQRDRLLAAEKKTQKEKDYRTQREDVMLKEIKAQRIAEAAKYGISVEEYEGILNASPEYRERTLANLRKNPRGGTLYLYTDRQRGETPMQPVELYKTPDPKHVSPDGFINKTNELRLRSTREFLNNEPGWGDTHQLLDKMKQD